MAINVKVLEDYINDSYSEHIGKYRYKCAYRSGENEFKAIYYTVDETLRKTEIFVDITVSDTLITKFSVNLNDQEKKYILHDVISKIYNSLQQKTILHYSLYENYVKAEDKSVYQLSAIDYRYILNYMKYHQGINQETIDQFYGLFMPSLEILLAQKKYEAYLDQIHFLFDSIYYEYPWTDPHTSYLDTEYQFHLYYLRVILKTIYSNMDDFYNAAPDKTFRAIKFLCDHPRFALFFMVDYIKEIMKPSHAQDELYKRFIEEGYKIHSEENNEDYNLIFSYLYYIYTNNEEGYTGVVKEILRQIIQLSLTYVNHDIDLGLGEAFLKKEGYNLLIEIFNEDYNTFLFTVFPIDSFPEEFKITVRDELCDAVVFFSGLMENEKYRNSALEQVININRLLLDNYREWYR